MLRRLTQCVSLVAALASSIVGAGVQRHLRIDAVSGVLPGFRVDPSRFPGILGRGAPPA